MKHIKQTTALCTFAATSLVTVPSAMAAGETAVAVSSNIAAPATVIATSAVAVAACIGWGVKSKRYKELEAEFYDYKVRTDFTIIKGAGAVSRAQAQAEAMALASEEEPAVPLGKHCKQSSIMREVGPSPRDTMISGPAKSIRQAHVEQIPLVSSSQQSDTSDRGTTPIASTDYIPKHASSAVVASRANGASAETPETAAAGKHIRVVSADAPASDGAADLSTKVSKVTPEMLRAVGWDNVKSPTETGQFLKSVEGHFPEILGESSKKEEKSASRSITWSGISLARSAVLAAIPLI